MFLSLNLVLWITWPQKFLVYCSRTSNNTGFHREKARYHAFRAHWMILLHQNLSKHCDANQNIIKSCCANGDASLTFCVCCCCCCCCRLEGSQLWGVWDTHWTAALVKVWLLSAGGWSCACWERRSGSVHVCERKREETRKRITGSVWEGNHYWNYMFAALEVIIHRN